jgi:hypothetical protein
MKAKLLIFLFLNFLLASCYAQLKNYFIPNSKSITYISNTIDENGNTIMWNKSKITISKENDSLYVFDEKRNVQLRNTDKEYYTHTTNKYVVNNKYTRWVYSYMDGTSNILNLSGNRNTKILSMPNSKWTEYEGKSIITYSISGYIRHYNSEYGNYDSTLKVTVKTNNYALYKGDENKGFNNEIDYYYYAKGVGLFKHEGGAVINGFEEIRTFVNLVDDFSKYSYLLKGRDLSKYNPDFSKYKTTDTYTPILQNNLENQYKVIAVYDWLKKKTSSGKEILTINLGDKYNNILLSYIPDKKMSDEDVAFTPQSYFLKPNHIVDTYKMPEYTAYDIPVFASNPSWMIPYSDIHIEERNSRHKIELSDGTNIEYDIAVDFSCNEKTYLTYFCVAIEK